MKYLITVIRIIFLALFLVLVLNGKMMLWLFLFGVSLIAALLFGRIYCGYACPMNTLMIPVEWISKKLKLQTNNAPRWLKNGMLPWLALIVSIVIMMLSKKVFKKNIPLLLIWVGISLIVTLRYKPNVFHNLICPFGALQRVFGKYAILSRRVDKDTCIGCKLCEKVCPSDAIRVNEDKKAETSSTLCLQCTNCQQVCPKNSISYIKKKHEVKNIA